MTITATEAATTLGVSLSTIYRRCRAGILAAVKIARRWAITITEQIVSDYTITEYPERAEIGQPTWKVTAPDGQHVGWWFTPEHAQAGIEAHRNPAASGRPVKSSFFGRGRREQGYTMYEGADGSERFNTQIWDES